MQITALSVPTASKHQPSIADLPKRSLKVSEDKPVGFEVVTIYAYDQDDEKLWYEIIGECSYSGIILSKFSCWVSYELQNLVKIFE